MNIISKIVSLFARNPENGGKTLVPVGRATAWDSRQQPMGLVQRANVERVHALLESADHGDPRDLFALYQEIMLTDAHMQGEFSKRKLALLGDARSILPENKTVAADLACAEAVRGMIKTCRGWMGGLLHLMDSTIWPVSVVEKVYVAEGTGYRLAELVPVVDQLLDFTEGRLRIRLTDESGRANGQYVEADPGRYIVHRGHTLGFPDSRGGPLRSLVFWWLLTVMDREWWARFLDRYGAPFLVGKYDTADEGSRSVLERAFSYATKIGGLVVSKETEVEIVQALTAGAGEAFEKFFLIGQREKSKLIVGQTLSAEAQPTGLGSGTSKGQEQVRQDLRQWDGAQLGETLQTQLFAQFCQANRLGGAAPKIVWGGEDAVSQAATGELVSKLYAAGLELTDAGIETLSERLGLPLQRKAVAPAPGEEGDVSGKGDFSQTEGKRGNGSARGALSGKREVKQLGARQVRMLAAPGLVEADLAMDDIARAGAADLARGFRGAFAPVRRAIEESASAEDLEERLAALYADMPVGRLAELTERALVAYAANGAAVIVEGREEV